MANVCMMGVQALSLKLADTKSASEGPSALPFDNQREGGGLNFFELVRGAGNDSSEYPDRTIGQSGQRSRDREIHETMDHSDSEREKSGTVNVRGPDEGSVAKEGGGQSHEAAGREPVRSTQKDEHKKEDPKKSDLKKDGASASKGETDSNRHLEKSQENSSIFLIAAADHEVSRMANTLRDLKKSNQPSMESDLPGKGKNGSIIKKENSYNLVKPEVSSQKIDELVERFIASKKEVPNSSKERSQSQTVDRTRKPVETQKTEFAVEIKEGRVLSLDQEKWQISGRIEDRHAKNSDNRIISDVLKATQKEKSGSGSEREFSKSQDQSRQGDSSSAYTSRLTGTLFRTTSGTDVREVSKDQSELFNSLVKKAKMTMGPDGQSSATIRLRPEILGNLTMDIRVDGNRVEAKLLLESDTAMKWLRDEIEGLKNELRNHGIHVDTFSVKIREPESSTAYRQYSDRDGATGQSGSDNAGEKDDRYREHDDPRRVAAAISNKNGEAVLSAAMENYESSGLMNSHRNGVNVSI